MARPRTTAGETPATDTETTPAAEPGAIRLAKALDDLNLAVTLLGNRVTKLEQRFDEAEGVDGHVVFTPGGSKAETPEERLRELEQRVAEAGRLLVFHGNRRPGGMTPAPTYLADVGRVLLFDTETPDTTTSEGDGTSET